MAEGNWDEVTYIRKKQPKSGQLKTQQVKYVGSFWNINLKYPRKSEFRWSSNSGDFCLHLVSGDISQHYLRGSCLAFHVMEFNVNYHQKAL